MYEYTNINANTTLPRLVVSWDYSAGHEIQTGASLTQLAAGFCVFRTPRFPKPFVLRSSDYIGIVFGCPVVGERIAYEAALKTAIHAVTSEKIDHLEGLNGQFLIFILHRHSPKLVVINDRFASYPIYYAKTHSRLLFSFLYFDLLQLLNASGELELKDESFFEYICLQRLLGLKNHDKKSAYLPPASVLSVEGGRMQVDSYWQPRYERANGRNYKDLGEEFIALLQGSIDRLTSDQERARYGLFLSGGHDSRTLLAGFKRPVTCFTVAFSDNFEVDCARKSAAAKGFPHHLFILPEDHLAANQDAMAILCGGLYTLDNALFVSLAAQVEPHADVLFHGHGLDYMFHGMYVVADVVKIFGHPTFLKKAKQIDGDVGSYFLNHISYRITDVDLFDLVSTPWKDRLFEYLRTETQKIVDGGRAICKSAEDSWEYLITHALTRHYSYPNMSSKMTNGAVRTVVFDNDLLNFYGRLPNKNRLHGDVLRYALNRLNPALAGIPAGNYGIAAGKSPYYKTMMQVVRKLGKHVVGPNRFIHPQANDRTWQDRDYVLRHNAAYRDLARTAIKDERLRSTLRFFDWTRIDKAYDQWLCQDRGGGKFVMSLVTLSKLFELLRL